MEVKWKEERASEVRVGQQVMHNGKPWHVSAVDRPNPENDWMFFYLVDESYANLKLVRKFYQLMAVVVP